MMTNNDELKLENNEIKEYLDKAIDYWRNSDEEYAKFYVDAFLSVHMSLFGYWIDTDGNRIEADN